MSLMREFESLAKMFGGAVKCAVPLHQPTQNSARLSQQPRFFDRFCQAHRLFRLVYCFRGGTIAGAARPRAANGAGGLDCGIAEFSGEGACLITGVEHRLKLMGVELRPTQPEQETTLPRAIVRGTRTSEGASVFVQGLLVPADNAENCGALRADVSDCAWRNERQFRSRVHGACIMLYSLGVSKRVSSLVACERAVPHRPGPVLAAGEVISQLRMVFRQSLAIELLNRYPDCAMQLLAALQQQAVVSHVLDYGVLEDIGWFGDQALLVDDLQRLQFGKQPFELSGKACNPFEQPNQELPSDHRSKLHCALAVLAEAVEASHNYSLDGLGNSQFAKSLGHPIAAVLAGDEAQIEECLGHLFDEERHALGFLRKSGLEFLGEQFAAEEARRHLERLLVGQMAQIDRVMETLGPEARRIAQPMR